MGGEQCVIALVAGTGLCRYACFLIHGIEQIGAVTVTEKQVLVQGIDFGIGVQCAGSASPGNVLATIKIE